MDTTTKVPLKPRKNYRIIFRDEDQLLLVKTAAARHGISFNRFVIEACEQASIALLKKTPLTPSELLSNAVLEAFPVEE